MSTYYNKAFSDYAGSKKMYYYLQDFLKVKSEVIDNWNKYVAFDGHLVDFPILVPTEILKKSGHLEVFKDEIFLVNESLALRPETATSIFSHLKELKTKLSRNPLILKQIGKAFRNEKTTRDKHYRLKEFEQMEVEVLHNISNKINFFDVYLERLKMFFDACNIKIKFIELTSSERPHYSSRTIDIYSDINNQESLELGCLNDRGNHDLYDLPAKEKTNSAIFECSLGLTRIIMLIIELRKKI